MSTGTRENAAVGSWPSAAFGLGAPLVPTCTQRRHHRRGRFRWSAPMVFNWCATPTTVTAPPLLFAPDDPARVAEFTDRLARQLRRLPCRQRRDAVPPRTTLGQSTRRARPWFALSEQRCWPRRRRASGIRSRSRRPCASSAVTWLVAGTSLSTPGAARGLEGRGTTGRHHEAACNDKMDEAGNHGGDIG